MSVNKVILIGNLGGDPDVRFRANGNPVVKFSLATSSVRKNKETGEKITDTEWHRVVCFDSMAEKAVAFLKKGKRVFVEGKLKTRKWTDSAGVVRYSTEIVAYDVQPDSNESSSQHE